MRKLHRYLNTAKPEFVEKRGVTYKVVDMGGYKVTLRVKSDTEIKRDKELFKLSKTK
jgi:hypothetical protein